MVAKKCSGEEGVHVWWVRQSKIRGGWGLGELKFELMQ